MYQETKYRSFPAERIMELYIILYTYIIIVKILYNEFRNNAARDLELALNQLRDTEPYK